MKKEVKKVCIALAFMAAFLVGWRVMPEIWPHIKEAVIYPVFPQLKPVQVPYQPKCSGEFGDPIAAGDSLIYYFYKDYCPWCRQLEPLTAGLPKIITLPDGTQSAVKFVCLNKVEDSMRQVITEYYEQYEIPEDKQYVPAIVIGNRYLFAGQEIIDQLMDALMAGEGLSTPLLDGGQRVE